MLPSEPANSVSRDFMACFAGGSTPGREWTKVKCPRCEVMVFEWDYESHKTAHSSEITPYLFLGALWAAVLP
jgi:hypothetical protein